MTSIIFEALLIISLYIYNVSASGWIEKSGNEPTCIGDGMNGTCVEAHRCLSTNPYITGLIYPKPCTLTGGKPGVCCTDCELVKNSSDAYLDRSSAGLLWKTGEKAWDKCIEYAQRYEYAECKCRSEMRMHSLGKCHVLQYSCILGVGGTNGYRGEFPHMALLGYSGTSSPSQYLCSGSLISDRFILTAAHCTYHRELGEITEAAFGVLSRSDPAENWHKYKIKRVIIHPEYKAPAKYHDIALLETEVPVVFQNRLILPACLASQENKINYESDNRITATGWGKLGYQKGLADTMQKVTLIKFSDEECKEMYPIHRRLLKTGLNTTTQMCYGDKHVIRDTCRGDSGGPLQMDTKYPTCMYTIIGVTSYGQECGFLGSAGVYTKVAKYIPWIESVVWP